MRRFLVTALVAAMSFTCSFAQRVTDKLDRGLVAVPARDGGNLVSWRMFGEEYYDTKYNLYSNGIKIATGLAVSNFVDKSGSAASEYQVEAVVHGIAQEKCGSVKAWGKTFMDVPVLPVVNRNGKTIANSVAGNSGGTDTTTSGYTLNDVSLADVDGDGICELIVKRNNSQGNLLASNNKTDFNLYECYKIDGTRLWWIDLGPNLMAGADEQWDMIGYDWDEDGKAEVLMRGADNMIVHTATGKTINVGDMTYYAPRDEYTHQGREYLLYLKGETGEPYLGWDGSDNWTPMLYPLPRFEEGEAKDVYNATSTEYAAVWGQSDTGHRSCKHYMGAPYLDGRHPAIFLGRGCYTRHKACALSVNSATHELTQLWRWNCYDSKSPWFGNGFHNFAIADVDMDGRDEIVYGSMVIDDTGNGLATTGLGHGDAQHCGDLDPYRWGLEQFTCQEGSEGNSYWNATTGQLYYRKADGGDDGRALAGNFTDLYPGGQARSVSSGVIGLSSDKIVNTNGDAMSGNYANLNNRIYWDGDLLDEIFNSKNGANRPAHIFKWGGSQIASFDAITNNWTKCNPSAQGDILGDWREELVLRLENNSALRIYATDYATEYGIYSLWHDHQYRNAMVWQCVGYNQPPHPSYFLGNVENITVAPPPLLLRGRTEVQGGETIGSTQDHLLVSGYENKTISVQDGASPYILTVNTPVWVQGTGDKQADAATPKSPARTLLSYTTTLTGGAFSGATRLAKQGEGTLVLPNVVEKHTGSTDIWNGTLQFDGTMESSLVWLNRHTTLISDGGSFKAGLKADYNAIILPGGAEKVGSIMTSDLRLGIGARVVFDVKGDAADQLSADHLTIETKDWEYGPKYKAPVFQFNVSGAISAGQYLLGKVGQVEGDLNDIIIEGVSGMRTSLLLTEGKLYLKVEEMRESASVQWNGTADNNVWDFGTAFNFLNNGQADYFTTGDAVVFDDQASDTNVRIKGAVLPGSITFNNDEKAYTLTGDSIVGGAPVIKNGAATVTISTENHTGSTTINGGKLVVNMLANTTGQTHGSLGDAKQLITINDGATLSANGIIITDQPVSVSGNAGIEVSNGMSLTFNKGFNGTGATVIKSGFGTMTLGPGKSYDRLVVKSGRVNAVASSNVDMLPAIVEFGNGVLWGANMEDLPGITNTTNFVVPEGCVGEFRGAFRGTYSGTLTGKGTFKPVSGGVRCYWNGDWSQFEGIIEPEASDATNRQNKKAYTPTFDFNNSKGLPKATLSLPSGFTFNSNYNIEIAKVTGSGVLGGSHTYTIGGQNDDIVASFSSTAPIVKKGDGYMEAIVLGSISGGLTIEGGELRFTGGESAPFFGTRALTLRGTGSATGSGLITSLSMESGSCFTPVMNLDVGEIISVPATLKTSAATTIREGATLNILINSATEYSALDVRFLTFNGTLKVTLGSGYMPKVGDSFAIWTGGSFSGMPHFDLPQLPAGLYWDTRSVAAQKGVLSITDDATVGIGGIPEDVVFACEVYTMGGACIVKFKANRSSIRTTLRKLGVLSGTYIVRMSYGNLTSTETISVR